MVFSFAGFFKFINYGVCKFGHHLLKITHHQVQNQVVQ